MIRYKKLTIQIGIAICFAGTSNASEVDSNASNTSFSSLCIEEKATGFDWSSKNWQQKNFIPEKYLITKIPQEKYVSEKEKMKNYGLFLCEFMDKSSKNIGKYSTISGCYDVKNFGDDSGVLSVNVCDEYWKDKKLEYVNCDKHYTPIRFAPNGGFIKYPLHVSVVPNIDSKISLVLSVGTCAIVN